MSAHGLSDSSSNITPKRVIELFAGDGALMLDHLSALNSALEVRAAASTTPELNVSPIDGLVQHRVEAILTELERSDWLPIESYGDVLDFAMFAYRCGLRGDPQSPADAIHAEFALRAGEGRLDNPHLDHNKVVWLATFLWHLGSLDGRVPLSTLYQ